MTKKRRRHTPEQSTSEVGGSVSKICKSHLSFSSATRSCPLLTSFNREDSSSRLSARRDSRLVHSSRALAVSATASASCSRRPTRI